jgi:hypothetical protein
MMRLSWAPGRASPGESRCQERVRRHFGEGTVPDPRPSYRGPGATRCPDATARTAYIDIFYSGTLVFRDVFVAVDGDRCYLPLPRNLEDLRVAPEYAQMTALLSTLSLGCGGSDFCTYFRRTGLKIGDLQWPHE